MTTEVQPLHTVTATETTGPLIATDGSVQSWPASYHNRDVRVQYWNALLASDAGTLTFVVYLSYNKGATWVSTASGTALTLSTTGQSGQQIISVMPNQSMSDTGVLYMQVRAVFAGPPTGPAVTYRADIVS